MKIKYDIAWPQDPDDLFIELILAKHWREMPYRPFVKEPWEHLLRACRMLFTPEQFKIHTWTEQHAVDWTTEQFCITWGAAASSKSNDYGLFVYLDWLTDPTQTVTIMASTTVKMLQMRSFESTLRYFKLMQANPRWSFPGKEHRQRLAIVNKDEADRGGEDVSVKPSIIGVAVAQGTLEEARAKLQGAHLPYVRLIADELSAMPEAVTDARHNLSIGAVDFRFFGLCNPDSIYDLACRHSVPIDGWASVDVNTDSWRTKWGKVRHHDGFKSPAVLEEDGSTKYPFLIGKPHIDRIVAEHDGNEDAPAIWTMVRGWPPPQGMDRTVMSETFVRQFGLHDPVEAWSTEPTYIAGLDPAFSSGGDKCILQIARVGLDVNGLQVIEFLDPLQLKLEASSPRPITYQISDQVLDKRDELDFDLRLLAVDDSGTQSVADVIEMEAQLRYARFQPVLRVVSSARASESPVSPNNLTPAKDFYANRITELWYQVAEYGRRRQLRRLPVEAGKQFCLRRVVEQSKRYRRLEGKEDFKKRLKHSPDEADAVAYVIEALRTGLGLMPGASKAKPTGDAPGSFSAWDFNLVKRYNNLASSYLTPGSF